MISNNVMSFMKKIVKSGTNLGEEDGGTSSTINKLRQTVTLGMTVRRGKPKPFSKDLAYLTAEERSILQRVWQKEKEFETESLKFSRQSPQLPVPPADMTKEKSSEAAAVPSTRSRLSCRICRKLIELNEHYHTCDECGQMVCEDCASYSKSTTEQSQEWKCSFCRRRQGQDRFGLEPPPGSGMHRVPSVRRMAEKQARKGSMNNKSQLLGLSTKVASKEEEMLALTTDKSQQITNDEINKSSSCLNVDSKESCNRKKQDNATRAVRKNICVGNSEESHKCRTRKDKKSLNKGKCIEDRLGPNKIKGSSSERRDQSKDRYCSSETPSDRRSSSESQKGPIHPLPVCTSVRMNLSGPHTHSTRHHHHGYPRESSQSESSLDEMPHSPEYDKRRRYRAKRKSKIQRQKSYDEDPDSDPCGYHEELATRSNATSSLESSSALESVENELDYWPREYSTKSERPLRHIASDAVLYVGHFSSETSDDSDVSAEYSTSEKSGFSGTYTLATTKRQKVLNRNSRKRKGAKRFIAPESSPSDEEDSHNHRCPEKSCSLDDAERHPKSVPTQIHKSIPCVYIDPASDHQSTKRSQDIDYGNWDFQRRSSTGRALPQIPDTHGFLLPSTRTQSTHSLDLPHEDIGRPERRASAPERENIKIVIDDVDSEQKGLHGRQIYLRYLLIRRDPDDAGVRTKGFGMRVMGGKNSDDGKLFAQISWIFPGGAAEKMGLKSGDKIMEWNGESLLNKTYEEVSAIIEKSGDVAELLVETSGRTRSFDSGMPGLHLKGKGTPKLILPTEGDIEPELSLLSPTRRKLPKTPDESSQHNPSHGEVNVQIWYDQDRSDLAVTLLSARGLKRRNSSGGSLPRAYAKLSLLPLLGYNTMKTPVSEPSLTPDWSKTFIFPDLTSDDIVESVLEIAVWDQSQTGNNIFIGETQIYLRRADLQDCPTWYPLTIHQNNVLSPTHMTTSHSSIVPSTPAHDIARKMLRRGVEEGYHSQSLNSEEKCETTSTTQEENSPMPRSSSMDLTLLHPNDAWDRHQVEPSENTLKEQTSPSNQGKCTQASRRSSSSLVSQDSLPELYGSGPKIKERVRSASFRVYRSADSDTEKAFESRKLGQIVKRKLSRTLSLKCDKEKRSIVLGNTIAPPEQCIGNISSPELTPDSDSADKKSPGQVIPKRLAGNSLKPKLGEIKLTFIMTKGQLEVDVVRAKGLPMNSGHPPDTYVKMYLKDGEKQLQKKKTKVVRHNSDPQYRQTLKYNASDVLGRTLLVMIWERQKGFEHNQAIGVAEIQLDKLELSKYTVGWYQLLPYSQSKAESTEST